MTELRTPPASRLPDLEAEQEVDLGRYWSLILTRWWLPVAGLVAGVVLGYLAALGGTQVYKARAVVYLGQPLSPTGAAQIQSDATNPATVAQIIHSESAIHDAAAAARMSPAELRGKISSRPVSGSIARLGQTPLVAIIVKGSRPRRVADAANSLAGRVVDRNHVGGYAKTKIESLQAQRDSDERQLAGLRSQIDSLTAALRARQGSFSTERLVLVSILQLAEQRRGTVEQDLLEVRQLLALAEQVELPRVVDRAVAVKTTARSTRNSAAVAGFLGLLLGILAALFWEPIAERTSRPE